MSDVSKATAGYRALRASAAWIDLRARGRIVATGEDRARLLHALATNHIEQLRPGDACYAFFLNAQGRILCDANVLCFENSILLDTEPETRVKLFEHLDRYIIADDVTIEDRTEALAAIGIEGPAAAEALRRIDIPAPEQPYHWLAADGRTVARISTTGADGFMLLLPAPDFDALVQRLAIPQASAEEARVVRIENGLPRYGEEITERNLVQETGQLRAVHFHKGCYLGQEIVERVRSRGHLHRMLRRLEIATNQPPAAGTKTDAAEIVSSAYSPALGKSVALAYVRNESAAPGASFEIQGAPAVVLDETISASPAPLPLET